MRGACDDCPYSSEAFFATSKFESQPSRTVSVVSENITYLVRRAIPSHIESEMILDPKERISKLEDELEQYPCEKEQNGNCAIADYAVHQYFFKQ